MYLYLLFIFTLTNFTMVNNNKRVKKYIEFIQERVSQELLSVINI